MGDRREWFGSVLVSEIVGPVPDGAEIKEVKTAESVCRLPVDRRSLNHNVFVVNGVH